MELQQEMYELRLFRMLNPRIWLPGAALTIRAGWFLVLVGMDPDEARDAVVDLFAEADIQADADIGEGLWEYLGGHRDPPLPSTHRAPVLSLHARPVWAAARGHRPIRDPEADVDEAGQGWRERADAAIREANAVLAAHDADNTWGDAYHWTPDPADTP